QTESAREAAKNFFCDLCQKGYQRHNEYETHIGSYDHQHKKEREPHMKEMSKNPQAAEKARRAERARDKEAGLVKLDMATTTTAGGGGFKKGGFKSAFGAVGAAPAPAPASGAGAGADAAKVGGGGGGFKKAFAAPAAVEDDGGRKGGKTDDATGAAAAEKAVEKAVVAGSGSVDIDGGEDGDDAGGSETDEDEDLGYERYDPARPTGCHDAGCGCHANVVPQVIFPV
ncbi:Zinc finger protein 804A, partial [Diplodia seriata]